MEVICVISDNKVITLVDSGATNNFISMQTAQKYNLEIKNDKAISVKLADGNIVKTCAFTICTV